MKYKSIPYTWDGHIRREKNFHLIFSNKCRESTTIEVNLWVKLDLAPQPSRK